MSSLEWRRDQPRVEPPRAPWFWIDCVVLGFVVLGELLVASLFVLDGSPVQLVGFLWNGWLFATFYPFGDPAGVPRPKGRL